MPTPTKPPPPSRIIGHATMHWEACLECSHFNGPRRGYETCDLNDAPDAHRLDGDDIECTAWEQVAQVDKRTKPETP